MKRLSRSLLLTASVVVLIASSSVAQLPGAGTSGSSSGNTAGAAKPLGGADKKFIKDAGEQVLVVTHLVGMAKSSQLAGEPIKSLSGKINADFDKIWGDLGTAAQGHKADLPKTDQTPGEKSTLEKLGKTEPLKFDKTFLKVLDKEMKKAAQIFQSADKSVQEPDLKTVVTNWTPKVKGYADEVSAAEAEASKRK